MGNGEGVTAGAGNPAFLDNYSVFYMWEDILTIDTLLDLLSKFVFVDVKEKEDEATGKIKRSENVIFPRYHQLEIIFNNIVIVTDRVVVDRQLQKAIMGMEQDRKSVV